MERNGDVRAKRKQGPESRLDRPTKQLKPLGPENVEDDEVSENGALSLGGHEPEDTRLLPLASTTADSAEWQATIEAVVRNVVSIRFCQTCSFDTDSAIASEATGFVVDAERGYILTNRHVVGSGPFWGFCIFDNHEEVDVHAVYRDPVHDFGLLRFDPKAIKYMPVAALKLRPDLARVGSEIRVVGNDAGEKLSILSGVISRLDRNAPEYGEGYSDFNTNYIQAAAAASGGSSGSPVVNIDGYAIALQAGGRSDGATTDYFLPLDRPLRALKCIQEGRPVTRGTIQCQWLIKPFDECRRLGLTPELEEAVRVEFPKETGMLVAEIVLPEGPADSKIEEGDILIKVNGKLLTQFVRLDEILDSHVSQKVSMLVQRGGENLQIELDVGDLHAITPDRFVTVTGAAFHDLSYQQARLYVVPVKGVFVCEAAGSFKFDSTESGWIIQTIDQKPTPDLKTFIEVMKGIPDRARVVVMYKHLRDLHTLNTSILYIDRHWTSKMRMAIRNDDTGKWDFTDLADALPPKKPVPRKANFIRLDSVEHTAAADIVRSFVRISCTMPVKLDGFPRTRKIGYGVVVDAEKGLVVVSRAIVPFDLCDISITVADSIIVDGKVLFLHPLENYAIVQYDPSLVQAPVKSANLSAETIKQGASTIFMGFNQNLRVVVAKTTVTDITAVSVPTNPSAPRYRAINLDAITVDTNLSGECGSGVLVSEDGVVQALWLSYLGERSASTSKDIEYHLGLATPTLLPIIKQIQDGQIPKLRMLNVEANSVQMSQVRIMGVSEDWIRKVEEENPERHQLFMVRKVECGHEQHLQEGDVIISLNGKLITRISDFDVMYNNDFLDAVIVRRCEEMHIRVPTVPTDDLETDRAVIFCGAILHSPHHAVRQQISKLHSKVYVSARTRGSPAYQYGLFSTNFITAVNGIDTPDLEAFLQQVNKIPDNTYFRLKVVTFSNVPWVVTMKKNDHYFPTMEFIKDPSEPCGWKRQTYENGSLQKGVGSLPPEAMDETIDPVAEEG
ncbi:MAG: histidinol-phosphate transaminase [Chaenotheca gracillima]|nr:MAG: histidinol-phosphate transaminase [Chaenotheca gracillima]